MAASPWEDPSSRPKSTDVTSNNIDFVCNLSISGLIHGDLHRRHNDIIDKLLMDGMPMLIVICSPAAIDQNNALKA